LAQFRTQPLTNMPTRGNDVPRVTLFFTRYFSS
jgi:hypothetical protein